MRVEHAIKIALDEVCRHTGWPVGHAYLIDSGVDGELRPSGLWHLDEPDEKGPNQGNVEKDDG